MSTIKSKKPIKFQISFFGFETAMITVRTGALHSRDGLETAVIPWEASRVPEAGKPQQATNIVGKGTFTIDSKEIKSIMGNNDELNKLMGAKIAESLADQNPGLTEEDFEV